MESIRKWFYRPKKDDTSLLAQFFFADEALNVITSELDSFDGRKDPERCNSLVSQLRQSQDKVLTIVNAIMDVLIGDERANRDFRVKFPEDVLQENLAGQLWFGAECLAAGSSIMNREAESTAMRPLAKALTKSLEHVRNLLRETCLRNNTYNAPLKLDGNELINEMLIESLKIFDRLFADFELCYVSAMVPVKSTKEHELQQMIGVLFSETLQQALRSKLLSQEMVDDCDPALMFAIPRLAIVNGLLIYPSALNIDGPMEEMSEMFRPFRTLLRKIRELLWNLTMRELNVLQKLLCDNEEIGRVSMENCDVQMGNLVDFVRHFCKAHPFPQQLVSNALATPLETSTTTPKTPPPPPPPTTAPSTSGYLIPHTSERVPPTRATESASPPAADSPPDRDSLEVISVAAATLSSILATEQPAAAATVHPSSPTKKKEDDSPNDSGISTENTSLDRSPSLNVFEDGACGCVRNTQILQIPCGCRGETSTTIKKVIQGQVDFSPGVGGGGGKGAKMAGSEEGTGSGSSSDTSSFSSMYMDEEEIELAMVAAESTRRHHIRSKFRSIEDLIHRLFVCIAGVADQLQTNFASDLRNILKSVFLINASDSFASMTVSEQPSPSSLTNSISDSASIEYHPSPNDVVTNHDEFAVDPNILAQEALFDNNVYFHVNDDDDEEDGEGECDDGRNVECIADAYSNRAVEELSVELNRRVCIGENIRNVGVSHVTVVQPERPPPWIPDVEAPRCMACGVAFTVVKRRHHCRNCGQVFCARCSANSVPLPKFGHAKPVRVCNKCFMYHLMPFTM